MGRSTRRVLILGAGLSAIALGLGAVGTAAAWHHLDAFWTTLAVTLGLGLAVLVVGLGWDWIQDETVDETAPRTVQFVYQPAPRKVIHSTVYYPSRSAGTEDPTLGLPRSSMPGAVALLEPQTLDQGERLDEFDLIADVESSAYERGLKFGRLEGFMSGLDAQLLPDPLEREPDEEDGRCG